MANSALASAAQSALESHINNPTGAHAGTAVSNTPAGAIAATTVQGAVNELDSEKTPIDGWVDDAAATWTRTANTTFTVTGDRTAVFSKGTRIRVTDTTTKYFVVVLSAHAAGTTTVTITGGIDYLLVANPTARAYSYAANPQGYPGSFNYTPTFTGFSAVPAIGDGTSVFSVVGNICTWSHNWNTAGTSNATTFTMTLPIADNAYFRSWLMVFNNSAAVAALGLIEIASGTTANLFTNAAGGAWTGSGTKNGRFVLIYQI